MTIHPHSQAKYWLWHIWYTPKSSGFEPHLFILIPHSIIPEMPKWKYRSRFFAQTAMFWAMLPTCPWEVVRELPLPVRQVHDLVIEAPARGPSCPKESTYLQWSTGQPIEPIPSTFSVSKNNGHASTPRWFGPGSLVPVPISWSSSGCLLPALSPGTKWVNSQNYPLHSYGKWLI